MMTLLAALMFCLTNQTGQVTQGSPADFVGANCQIERTNIVLATVSNPAYIAFWWMRSLADQYGSWSTNTGSDAGTNRLIAIEPWPCTQDQLIHAISIREAQGWPAAGCAEDRAYVLAHWKELLPDLTVAPPATQ